ncbi:PREDICTED: uncharacterized protein LOC104480792, partial [Chlamydotis macqueenii]|uniref:uncharacterized protein LOC104480792 n=1 Tax=Chlamydotis macqueenii TaxID=187382 RepID=UPI0005299E23
MSSSNRELVIDFVSYKLSQKGYSWSQLEEEDENRTDFAGEEAEMDGVLNGSPSWHPPASHLFRDGVNWGRIVAFFSFGGALCVESVDKEMRVLVGRIVSWMTTYLTDHLDPWIQENGGWPEPLLSGVFLVSFNSREWSFLLSKRSAPAGRPVVCQGNSYFFILETGLCFPPCSRCSESRSGSRRVARQREKAGTCEPSAVLCALLTEQRPRSPAELPSSSRLAGNARDPGEEGEPVHPGEREPWFTQGILHKPSPQPLRSAADPGCPRVLAL